MISLRVREQYLDKYNINIIRTKVSRSIAPTFLIVSKFIQVHNYLNKLDYSQQIWDSAIDWPYFSITFNGQ